MRQIIACATCFRIIADWSCGDPKAPVLLTHACALCTHTAKRP